MSRIKRKLKCVQLLGGQPESVGGSDGHKSTGCAGVKDNAIRVGRGGSNCKRCSLSRSGIGDAWDGERKNSAAGESARGHCDG